jgi:hypothetical protein
VAAGRRLLLVVNGHDEDTGGDRPSIASLLPADPPEGVLVVSRPHPGLPDDVPGGHPLRTVVPVELSSSPHAAYVELLAKTRTDPGAARPTFQRHVVGLITASGGGLTRVGVSNRHRVDNRIEWLYGQCTGREVDGTVEVLNEPLRRCFRPVCALTTNPVHPSAEETLR